MRVGSAVETPSFSKCSEHRCLTEADIGNRWAAPHRGLRLVQNKGCLNMLSITTGPAIATDPVPEGVWVHSHVSCNARSWQKWHRLRLYPRKDEKVAGSAPAIPARTGTAVEACQGS